MTIAFPKPNEVVGLNEPFPVAGSTALNYLDEVTVQVDNGPVKRAVITTVITPPPQPAATAIFSSWGIVTTLGKHVVTVTATYYEGGNKTQTVNIQALGQPE
jgi:hypothetical protein